MKKSSDCERRLLCVERCPEGNRVPPLEGNRESLEQKHGLSDSYETTVIRRPISWTNSMARRFHAPAVSIATGTKMWVFASSPYLTILLTAALLAAAAGSIALSPTYQLLGFRIDIPNT